MMTLQDKHEFIKRTFEGIQFQARKSECGTLYYIYQVQNGWYTIDHVYKLALRESINNTRSIARQNRSCNGR